MPETVSEQIDILKAALPRVTEGSLTESDLKLVKPANAAQRLDVQLQALNLASQMNLVEAIKNNHQQIFLALGFAQTVTYYARLACPDLALWTTEINDDIEQNKFLFVRAQSDLDLLLYIAPKDPDTYAVVLRQKQLLDTFNDCNKRCVDGLPMFDDSQKTEVLTAEQAVARLEKIRHLQKEESLNDIACLTERALWGLKRIHLIRSIIKPAFDAANDPAAPAWDQDILVTRQNTASALDNADTVLRFHTVRHSAFSQRLAFAVQQSAGPN